MSNLVLKVNSALAQREPLRTRRVLDGVQRQTLARMARVQGEEMVQGDKIKAIDHLSREGMIGQAILLHFRDVLAGGDPFKSEDLRFFTEMAKVGKGEIIADTVDTFCRESRNS